MAVDPRVQAVIDRTASGEISTVPQFDEAIDEQKFPLETEVLILFGIAIQAPEQKVLLRSLFESWRQRQYPFLKKRVEAEVEVSKFPYSMQFSVDDMVFLQARLDSARSRLLRYGSWWKVRSGYNAGKSYMLESIHCKGKTQKRTEPKGKIEFLIVGRTGDDNYDVTNVIKSPCSVDQIP